MPGIQIEFDKDIYEGIPNTPPGKKRGWIRDLVIAEVLKLRNGGEEVLPSQYAFRVKGKVYKGVGFTPAEAAKSLGIDMGPLVEWRTGAEAAAEGWFEETSPMDV